MVGVDILLYQIRTIVDYLWLIIRLAYIVRNL